MYILCFQTRKSPPPSIVAEERQALALLGLPLGNFAVCFLHYFLYLKILVLVAFYSYFNGSQNQIPWVGLWRKIKSFCLFLFCKIEKNRINNCPSKKNYKKPFKKSRRDNFRGFSGQRMSVDQKARILEYPNIDQFLARNWPWIYTTYFSPKPNSRDCARYVSRVAECHKKIFQHLTMIFRSTWWARGLQKYAINWNLMMAFWATTNPVHFCNTF